MNIFNTVTPFAIHDYIIVTYFLEGRTSLRDAAWNLAMGQSVGNPNLRSAWETEDLFRNHACIILHDEAELQGRKKGTVRIAFPLKNINLLEDGISQLLCQIMGGQLDIDEVIQCHVNHVDFPATARTAFKGPQMGIPGIRTYTMQPTKPLLGGIVKPKVGVSVATLLDIVKAMVDGGLEFIKEDEILANPAHCPLRWRAEVINTWLTLNAPHVIYAMCINGDSPYVLQRTQMVHEFGANAVHLNWWSGLGTYRAIRDQNLQLFLHFQKSGDRIITNERHAFHIKWNVICQLAAMSGVDFIHAGMFGGYLSNDEIALKDTLSILRQAKVMPALSCGLHPGLVETITTKFGNDVLLNVGGAIHGHPGGTTAGVRAMRQAIDGETSGKEYLQAIDKWGKV